MKEVFLCLAIKIKYKWQYALLVFKYIVISNVSKTVYADDMIINSEHIPLAGLWQLYSLSMEQIGSASPIDIEDKWWGQC